MLTLVRAGEALAADQAANGSGGGQARTERLASARAAFGSSVCPVPDAYSLAGVPESKTFSTKDFRPRGHSILDSDPRLNLEDDALVHDTSVWQQLSEYRTHNRIRVLTLFESRASELSLQAGKERQPVAAVDQPVVELAPGLARSARPPVSRVRHRREQSLTRRPAPGGTSICREGSGCNRPRALRTPDSALTDRLGANGPPLTCLYEAAAGSRAEVVDPARRSCAISTRWQCRFSVERVQAVDLGQIPEDPCKWIMTQTPLGSRHR